MHTPVVVEIDMPDGRKDIIGLHPDLAEKWSRPVEVRDGVKADRPECRILTEKEVAAHRAKVRKEAAEKREEMRRLQNESQRELVRGIVAEMLTVKGKG